MTGIIPPPTIHNQNANSSNNSRGNVLFLILIAVALFAALSYAVTQSTRSGGGDASKESNLLKSSELIQYATSLQTAITRLTLSSGCSDTTISFDHDSFTYDYENVGAPSNGSCNIFGPEGGGIAAKPPADVVPDGAPQDEYWFIGCMEVGGLGRTGTGATSKELMVQAFLTREACLSVNEKLGITNPGGNPPQYDYGQTDPASANYCQFASAGNGGNPVDYVPAIAVGLDQPGFAYELAGQPTGCYQNTTDQLYRFYHVLIAR